MRLQLRWKFFLILTAFSLIPLAVVIVVSQYGTRQLSSTINQETTATMMGMVGAELEQTAVDSATILDREIWIASLGVGIMARDAGLVLSGPGPNGQSDPEETPVYGPADFDDPTAAPPGTRTSSRYPVTAADGKESPGLVSFESAVTLFFPEGSGTRAGLRDARLVTPLLVNAGKEAMRGGDMLYRLYISLENGVHVSYPGHGFYPKGYDPKSRSWYTLGRDSKKPVWTPPVRDACTGLPIFTVAQRIVSPEGKILGVAAVDILISRALQTETLEKRWSEDIISYFVSLSHGAGGESELRVLGTEEGLPPEDAPPLDPGATAPGSAPPPNGIPAEPPKATLAEELANPVTASLLGSLKESPSGSMFLPFQGRPAIWAWGEVQENSWLVVIAPAGVATRLPRLTSEKIASHTKSLLLATGLTALAVVGLIALVAFYYSRSFINPILLVSQAWRRLAEGDFSVRLNLKSGDERDMLYSSFNETVPRLEENMHMRRALELAQEVQQSLLPAREPEIEGFDVAGASLYCDETGGDYYDYIKVDCLPGESWDVLIADVTGHGVAPALLMASARSFLRSLSHSGPAGLAERVELVNRLLTPDVYSSGRFMTLFMVELSTSSPRIKYVRAGHDPGLLFDPETGEAEELTGDGAALGIFEESCFEEKEAVMDRPGAVLVMGTDGIWEARGPSGEMYGKERFMESVRQSLKLSAREIMDRILGDLTAFRQSCPQEDDVTLTVIKKV